MTARVARAALVALAVVTTLAASAPARAEDEALVRVVAEEAGVHTGPGFGYRVVYVARRDEVLPALGRASNDKWFRVQLPDGTYGWILLATPDLDGTFEKVQASDAEVVQEPTLQPYGIRDCAFRDPAGNLVRIQELA